MFVLIACRSGALIVSFLWLETLIFRLGALYDYADIKL